MFFGIRDPRSGIRDGKKPGSGIRDKHPGSSTLLKSLDLVVNSSFCSTCYFFSDEESVVSGEPRLKSLKYEYKEDQWSPLNPEGKKQYDRKFLICLQNDPLSLQKPSNLPNMEIVKVGRAPSYALTFYVKTSVADPHPHGSA
jgi:hypothetical protein